MTCPFSLPNEPKVDRFPYVDSVALIYITLNIINQIINDKKKSEKKKSSDIISGDSAAYFEKSDKNGILFSVCHG